MKTISYSSESFPAQVASGGIAMGKALIIGKKAFLEKNYDSSDPSIFLASIQETKFQLKDLASTKSQIEGDILEFQLSLLDDSELIEPVLKSIRANETCSVAWQKRLDSMIVEFENMIKEFGIPTDILDAKFSDMPIFGGQFPDVSLREAISDPEARERLISSQGAISIPQIKQFLTSESKEEQINAVNELKDLFSSLGQDTSALEYLTQEGFPQPVQEFISAAAEGQGEKLSRGARQFLGIEEGGDFDLEEVQKEIIDVVKDEVISSNPLLQQIMNLFNDNKGLFTLLGGAVGVAGLSGLLGGGMFGGFAAGAGGVAAARLALGPEGFAELQNTVQQAAAPVFDIFSEFVAEGTPLGDLPVVGNILRGTIGVGRENPLAAIALASGNIGAAAGLVAGQTGIGVLDGTVNPEDLAQNLSSTFGDVNRVLDALGIAQAGASSDGGGRAITTGEQTAQARNNYARGNPGQSASIDELFNYQDTSLTNDFGYGGNGVQALA